MRGFAHFLALFGLVLVLCGRGCDSMSSRNVARARARFESAQNKFEDDYARKLAEIDAKKQDKIKEGGDPAGKQVALAKLDQEKAETNRNREKERNDKLQAQGEWHSLKAAARDADVDSRRWGYTREFTFIGGTLLLVLGLLTLGLGGEGAERYLCMAMLAIITFSIYVAGAAWIGAAANTLKDSLRGL